MSALDQVGEALRRGALAIRRANQRLSKVETIADLQREVGPGLCCFCEGPATGMHCGSDHCLASYNRLYRAGRSARRWARGLTADGKTPSREKNRGRPGPFGPLRGDR